MKQKIYQIYEINSKFIWVDYFIGKPSELLKESFHKNSHYYLKGIDIDLSKDELIGKLNELNI